MGIEAFGDTDITNRQVSLDSAQICMKHRFRNLLLSAREHPRAHSDLKLEAPGSDSSVPGFVRETRVYMPNLEYVEGNSPARSPPLCPS